MEKIYEDAVDLNVRAYVVYGKTADKKLYLEKDCKTQAAKAEVEDAFKKGMLLIMDGSNILKPISMAGTTVKTVTEASSTVSLVSWAVASA